LGGAEKDDIQVCTGQGLLVLVVHLDRRVVKVGHDERGLGVLKGLDHALVVAHVGLDDVDTLALE